jgi:hypothetical protein
VVSRGGIDGAKLSVSESHLRLGLSARDPGGAIGGSAACGDKLSRGGST